MISVSVKMFEIGREFFSKVIWDIFNKCFIQGIYPDLLNVGRVVHVFKGGSPYDL